MMNCMFCFGLVSDAVHKTVEATHILVLPNNWSGYACEAHARDHYHYGGMTFVKLDGSGTACTKPYDYNPDRNEVKYH